MPFNSFENYPMSWKPQKPHTGKPLYLALADQLEADIARGVLLPGTKLPPYRELADYLDVNVSTITRAFKVCKQKGLLSGTVGSGTFVSYDTTADTRMTRRTDSSFLVEMGPIFPRSNTTDDVICMLKKMIIEPDFGKLLQYGNPEGSIWQKEAAIKLIRKAGYDTKADHLIPATGGQNAIAAIMAGLFRAGDRIGVDPLTYPGVKTCAKMLGIELIPIQHENDEISEAGLLHACTNEHIKGLYIMPDYQNPTTHTMSLSGRKMIAKTAKENNLIVIEDSAHSLLNENPLPAVASFAPEHTVYISSLSKTVAPGFRLAYVVSPLQYKSILSDALYNINLSLSPFLTELASRMIASESVDRIIEEHRQVTRNRNHLVNQYLPKHLLIGADECIFRWLLLPENYTGKEFEKLAQQAGVQVYASERFAVGKAKPPAAVRIVVTTPETIDELRTGLEVLKKLLSA
ncbi:PLP-dependent aminotransferase family protein [Geosporobacter ferrireducens]|uniref:aminotransferase-like domain-containing protein n=1 Tax=Geosporobacter ferrireducens TaxID=1424294 RepID=UPI00139DF165|nr:PLP-dependent aminotransferase family protein [Geosporobacter ferrireducens]MTI56320.1 PLP-dependent aminotransferase family protein [Geosporobacter ferrireducens]